MIILIIVLASLIAWVYYKKTVPVITVRQRIALFLLRTCVLSLIGIFLLSPVLRFFKTMVHKPELVVLKDISKSMMLKTDQQIKSKILEEPTDQLIAKYKEAGYKIKTYQFSDGLKNNKETTNLVPALEELTQKGLLSDAKQILIVSDGWWHDQNQDIFTQFNTPTITILPAIKATDKDIRIARVAGHTAYQNEQFDIGIDIQSEAYSGPVTAELIVGNKVVASKNLMTKANEPLHTELTHSFSQTGLYQYEVRLKPLADETNKDNNRYPGAVQVLAEKQRILVLTDQPDWDLKFITDTIRQNSRWSWDNYVITSNGIQIKGQSIPNSTILANDYRLCIWINHRGDTPIAQVSGLIKGLTLKGSNIWLIGIPPTLNNTNLPTTASSLRNPFQGSIAASMLGQNMNSIIELSGIADKSAPIQYYYVVPKKGSQILATITNDQKSPAISLNTETGYKVLHFAFTQFWRWQLNPDKQDMRTIFGDIIQWMTLRSVEQMLVKTDKQLYFKGEAVTLLLNAYDEKQAPRYDLSPQFTIKDSNGKVVSSDYLTQGEDRYQAMVRNLSPGKYSFQVTDTFSHLKGSGNFFISDQQQESRDIGFNLPMLSWIADQTNGTALSIKAIKDYIPPIVNTTKQEKLTEIPLYRSSYLIVLFLICFATELFLRRRWGLI